MISEKRDRFLRVNPSRLEKAVKAIDTLSQTGNKSSYEYDLPEARATFEAIESAAERLWDAFSLNGDAGSAGEPEAQAVDPDGFTPDKRRFTICRSNLNRAIKYLNEGDVASAMTKLNALITISDEDFEGGDITTTDTSG